MAICKYCGKEIEDSKIGGHTTFCIENPNRERNLTLSKSHIGKMVLSKQRKRKSNPGDHTKQWIKSICEKCGKEFEQYTSKYSIQTGKAKRFCCRKCANSHPKSCEGKTKICKCIDCGANVEVKKQTNPNLVRCPDCLQKHTKETHKETLCIVCGKIAPLTYTKSGKYSKTSFCSDECKHIHNVHNGKKSYELAKEKGTHKPWQSRNISSYPETFWKNVLINNDIKFIREYHFEKKYFLDFYIEYDGRKIDLEIDGGQHLKEDHIKHDKIRDEFIKSHGLEVYRIPWNSINTEKGKIMMKEKINNFLFFLNKITKDC